MKKLLRKSKEFWNYVWHGDSFGSYVLSFLFAFIIIKYIFFPGLGLLLNNDFPLVAIVSGSMEHKIVDGKVCSTIIQDVDYRTLSFDEWWTLCGTYYTQNTDLKKEDFESFPFKNGLNKGDVMILYGKSPENIDVGDILVFEPGDLSWYRSHGPVIHRVVDKWQDESGDYHFKTKGDHNPVIIDAKNFEADIHEDKVFAVGVFRIPYLGYGKLFLVWLISPFTG